MAQLYPDGMREVNLSVATGQGNFTAPPPEDFDTEAMRGSMQQILSENLGEFVVVEFLIGTQSVTMKQGILYAVGRSTITVFEELTQTFVVCDLFSIKFVTFYMPGQRPGQGRPTRYTPGMLPPGVATPEMWSQMSSPCPNGECGGYRSLGGR